MRILIVNKYARVTGGADVVALGLAEGLRGRGHEVAMLSTASPENLFGDGEFVDARSPAPRARGSARARRSTLLAARSGTRRRPGRCAA